MNPFDMRGPDFLVFYACLSAVVILLVYLMRPTSGSTQGGSPDLSDPYLFACLRGGAGEASIVAALTLMQRNLITNNSDRITANTPSPLDNTAPAIEKEVLAYFGTSRQRGDFNRIASSFVSAQAYEATLREMGLFPSESAQQIYRWETRAAIALLVIVALIKIGVALTRGRPFMFLVFMCIFAVVLVRAVQSRVIRTQYGEGVLSNTRNLFSGLRERVSALNSGSGSNDLLWLSALYGIAAVPTAAFPFVDEFRRWLTPPSSSGSSCSSSGCGSSCGGGGCGGGCGGCGS